MFPLMFNFQFKLLGQIYSYDGENSPSSIVVQRSSMSLDFPSKLQADPLDGNLRMESLSRLKPQTTITFMLLLYLQNYNCIKLRFYIKLILDLILVILYNNLNCAVDKTTKSGNISDIGCFYGNFFIISWCNVPMPFE